MYPRWSPVQISALVARHYRTIVFALVLVNTALIVFLLVYIWTYGLDLRNTRKLIQGSASGEIAEQRVPDITVVVDNLVVWSKPGGAKSGGVSRGVLERGNVAPVLDSVEQDGELWFVVDRKGWAGWVPAKSVRFIDLPR